jgi:membrane protease YdiL (CAAX protease family)
MEEKNRKSIRISMGVWDVLYPLLMYYAVTIIIMFATQMILGSGTERYVLCQIITSAVTIPVMYQSFYRRDKAVWPFGAMDAYFKSGPVERESAQGQARSKKRIRNAVLIVCCAALIGTGLNNLILMSPLAEASAGFAEANSNFYGSTLALELISSALLTPVLEEMVYRGIIFARIKRMLGFLPAMVLSALIFAIMHFNLVQFVYAFLLGMVLAVFMEKTGHMYGAVLGHITANALAVIRTETGFLDSTVDGSLRAWLLSAGCLIAGLLLLGWYVARKPS